MTAASSDPDSANARSEDVRLIAFYLPQFHPIPENDQWWGKGFTEWTNTTKAEPLFPGHYQPHLPTDFGFYDLRLRDTRREQIEVAKQYGIDGFCYHYYWFAGKRLLEKPVDDMLADPQSDMPFCFCWANENWTRRWDAAEHEILIAQTYTDECDCRFADSLIPYFKDPRYIKVNNAPLLIVYRPQHLPDSKKSIAIWRERWKAAGIPDVYLVCALTHGNSDYAGFGFDAGVEFPPHAPGGAPHVTHEIDYFKAFQGIVFDFKDVANLYLNRDYTTNRVFRSVVPSWDNTARRSSRALVILNGTPRNYEFWLKDAVKRTLAERRGSERLVFINAWNEWAEGCHLEPDRKFGRGFLEATKRVKAGLSALTDFGDVFDARKHTFPKTQAAEQTAVSAQSYASSCSANRMLRIRRMIGRALKPFPTLRAAAVRIYQRFG